MGFITDRQYLDFKHREEVRKLRSISADDFKDKTDRTLTISQGGPFSSEEAGAFRHIFLLNGELYLHVYKIKDTGEYESSSWRTGDLRTADVAPGDRRAASVTDLEFAKIMENLHTPIEFYAPASDYGKFPELDKNSFGLTTPSWADEKDF